MYTNTQLLIYFNEGKCKMNKTEFLNKLKEDLSSLTDEERANALKYYEEYFADAGNDDEKDEKAVITEFISPENVAGTIINEIKEIKDDAAEPNITTTATANAAAEEPVNLKIDFNNYTYENLSETYNDSTVKTKSDNSDNTNISQNSAAHPKTNKINNTDNTWKIVLLLCTAPIWLPLIIGLGSAAFGIVMAILAVSFAVASVAVAGIAMVGAGFFTVGYGIVTLFTDFFSAFYNIGAGLIVVGVGIIIAYAFTKLSVVLFKSQFKFAGFVIRGIARPFSRQNA